MRNQIIVVLLASTLCTGCATPRPITHQYVIEPLPAVSAEIRNIEVHQEKDGILVHGKIHKAHRFILPGHVDVQVVGPDGLLLGETRQQISGANSRKRGIRDVSFSARVKLLPPAGSTIRIKYHVQHESSLQTEDLADENPAGR